MASNLGVLTLDVVAKIGGFTSGLDAAGRAAEKNAKKSADAWRQTSESIQSSIKIATTAFVGLSAAGTVAYAFIKAQADAIDAFNDIRDATGASIEGISALDRVARETGSNIDAVQAVLIKFNAALKDAKPGDDTERLFKALNLNISELKSQDPAEALRMTAVAFAQFESDGNKARAMQELFGKSVKDAAPFLNDLADKTELVGTMSTQSAAMAEVFNKQLFELKANATDASRAFANDLIPSLTSFLQNYKELKAQGHLGLILKDAAKDIVGLGKLTGDNGADINRFIKERDDLQAEMDKETRPLVRANDDRKQKIDELNEYLEIARLKQRNEIALQSIGVDYSDAVSRRNRPPSLPDFAAAPKIAKGPKDNSAEQILKAQLGADLDTIKTAQQAMANTFANSEKVLSAMRAAGLTDESQYYREKRALLDESTASQVAAQQDIIARLQKEKVTGKDAIDTERKIADARAEIAKVQANATAQAKVMGIEEESAYKKITAAILSARQAAQDYLDTSNKAFGREIAGIGKGNKFRDFGAGISAIEDKFSQQRRDLENTRAQAELANTFTADARRQYQERLGILDEFQGKEIDSYKTKYEILNAAQKDWTNGALEALANYSDEAGNVAKHTEEAFSNAFKGLEDQITNLLTGKGADLRSLLDSIATDATRSFVKEQVTGPLASMAKDFLGLRVDTLGSGAGSAASMAAFTASTTGASAALAALTAAATTAAVAMGGSSIGSALSTANLIGSSGGDALGSLISSMGWMNGGFTGVGPKDEVAGVVHKGEYVIDAETTRRIGVNNLSQGRMGGGFSMVNNFTIQGTSDRRTETQIAAQVRRSTQSAAARFG